MGDKVRHTTERGSRSGGQIPRYRLPQASVGYDNLTPALRRDVTASRMAARAVQAEKKVWDRARAITEQGTFLVEKLEGLISEAQLEQTVRETLDRVPVVEGMLADVTGRVETAEASIEDLGDQITLKADKSVLDAVAQRVTTAEARLDVLADEISAKVSQEDFDLLAGRVSTAEATLQIHAGEIATKASQQEVDLLTGRVTQAEADIVATAGLIQSEVSRIEGRLGSSDPSVWYSSIKQTADEIESVVAMLNSDAQATGQFSSIKQTADAIDFVVSTLNEAPDAPTQFSSIKQTVQEISSIVALLNSDPDVAGQFSAITQLAGEIDLRVHKDEVITAINLSPEGVAIQANKVEFLTQPIPKAIPQGATLFHFDHGLRSTGGLAPLPGYVATLRPGEGRFGGAVAVEEGTTNLVNTPDFSTYQTYSGLDVQVIDDPRSFTGKVLRAVCTDPAINQAARVGTSTDGVENGTFSVYIRAIGSAVGAKPRVYFGSSPGSGWVDSDLVLTSEFQRLVLTGVTTTGEARVGLQDSRWEVGAGIEIHSPQLEAKPFATSFVDGTRAAGRLTYPLVGSSEFTVAVWFKGLWIAENKPIPNWRAILQLAEKETSGSRWWFEVDNDGSGNPRFRTPAGVLAPYDNEWHHFVVVRRSNGVHQVYFDGEYKHQGTSGWTPAFLRLGHQIDGGAHLNCLFDELLILPYAASDEEIRSWYEQAAPFYDPAQQLQALDNQIWIDSTGLNMQNVAVQNKLMNLNAHRLAFWDADGEVVAGMGNIDDLIQQLDPGAVVPGMGVLIAQGAFLATQGVLRRSIADFSISREKITDGAIDRSKISDAAVGYAQLFAEELSVADTQAFMPHARNDSDIAGGTIRQTWGTHLATTIGADDPIEVIRVTYRLRASWGLGSRDQPTWDYVPTSYRTVVNGQVVHSGSTPAESGWKTYTAIIDLRQVSAPYNIQIQYRVNAVVLSTDATSVVDYSILEKNQRYSIVPAKAQYYISTTPSGCTTGCEISCQSNCQKECQSDCQYTCQHTGEGGCSTACESSCQSTCEKRAQGGCFVDGTPVTVYDPETGEISEIPIEELKPGMFMPYYDPQTDRVMISECVSNEPSITATLYEITVEAPNEPIVLRATPEQPFDVWRKNRLTGEWGWSVIQTQYLKPGDKMIRPFDEQNRMPNVISVVKLPPQPPTRVWDPTTVARRYIVAGFADAFSKH